MQFWEQNFLKLSVWKVKVLPAPGWELMVSAVGPGGVTNQNAGTHEAAHP